MGYENTRLLEYKGSKIRKYKSISDSISDNIDHNIHHYQKTDNNACERFGYTIIATAIIWCMCIIVQSFLFRMPLHKDMLFDLLASFVFSLGIGYVYQVTGLIIISMIAHFCERIVSCYILSRKHDTSI